MTGKPLGYKLLLSYEVKPEVMQEYYQFIMGRYVPILQSMGMQMSAAANQEALLIAAATHCQALLNANSTD